MMDKLNSKRIIITGGSLGIGFAIAKACAGQGAEVIIAARNQGNLEDSLKKIKSISEKNHIAYSLDVGDLKAVKVFAEWIKNEGLVVNGLVNCAGIVPQNNLMNCSEVEWHHTLNTNLTSVSFPLQLTHGGILKTYCTTILYCEVWIGHTSQEE